MSRDIDVLVWASTADRVSVFVDVVRRMLARATGVSISLRSPDTRPIGDYSPEIDSTEELLLRLLAMPEFASGRLTVGIGYRLQSEAIATLYYSIVGPRCLADSHAGDIDGAVSQSGPLRRVYDTSGVLADNMERFLENAFWNETHADAQEAIRAASADLEEMLMRSAGLLEEAPSSPVAQHGAIYFNCPWESPLQASVIYHRDVAEFARDFARIYLLSRNSTICSCAETFSLPGERIWELDASPDEYWKDCSKQLSRMPASEMLAFFRQAIGELPYGWIREMGDRGVIIGTHIFSSLLPVYKRVAQLAGVADW